MNERGILPAVQHQILLRLLLALASLTGGIVLWCMEGIAAAAPFILLALLLAAAALRIRRCAEAGRYLALHGTILSVETTALLHRPKAVLIAVDGKAIRLELHSRRKAVQAGQHITLYVLDDTPLYEWRELHMLANYLALTLEG